MFNVHFAALLCNVFKKLLPLSHCSHAVAAAAAADQQHSTAAAVRSLMLMFAVSHFIITIELELVVQKKETRRLVASVA